MAYKDRLKVAPSIAITQDGARKTSQLQNEKRNKLIKIRVTAQVDITVAGTGLKNRGSILAALVQAAFVDAGKDVVVADPRLLRFIGECFAPSPLPFTRLSGAGVQAATQVAETFYFFLAAPGTMTPEETYYLEEDVKKRLEVALQSINNPITRLVAGAVTGTITNFSASIQQDCDDLGVRPLDPERAPMLSVLYDEQVEDITGINPDKSIEISVSEYLAGIFIQQENDLGETTGIIQKLALKGDRFSYFGDEKLSMVDLIEHQALDFGGAVTASGAGYLGIYFPKQGRLSNCLHPNEQANLRLMLDVTPVGAGSKLRIGRLKYQRTPTTLKPLSFGI